MSDGFKDYIPEGENLGAFSAGTGYQDFAPDPVAKPQVEVKVEQAVVAQEKTKELLKCDKCEYTTPTPIALAGHKRSHK